MQLAELQRALDDSARFRMETAKLLADMFPGTRFDIPVNRVDLGVDRFERKGGPTTFAPGAGGQPMWGKPAPRVDPRVGVRHLRGRGPFPPAAPLASATVNPATAAAMAGVTVGASAASGFDSIPISGAPAFGSGPAREGRRGMRGGVRRAEAKAEAASEEAFDSYFEAAAEARVNERMRKFDEGLADSRWYEVHYREHHLREFDDDRVLDDRAHEERSSDIRADDERFRERFMDDAHADRASEDARMEELRMEMSFDEADDFRDAEERMRMEREQARDDEYRWDDD